MNYLHLRCIIGGKSLTYWCGSGGCLYQIFASTKDEYSKTELELCVGIRFFHENNKYFVTCFGKGGSPKDDLTFVWNGREFVAR